MNSWHISVRGTNTPPGPAWFPDPNKDKGNGDPSHPAGCPSDSGMPDPGANPPAALYPDNLWALNVLTGTAFPPSPSPPSDSPHFGQLKAGGYVILTGTLWEDIAHLISDPNPIRVCFNDVFDGQGGWLEIHPVDVVRYAYPPPPLRKHPEVLALCSEQGFAMQNWVITPDDNPQIPREDNYATLHFQEMVDPRFTDPSTVLLDQVQVDRCDPTKLDVSVIVNNTNGVAPAYFKSV